MFVFFASFLMYLVLVWSGGKIPPVEFAVAFLIATVLALSARTWIPSYRFSFLKTLNPLRWFLFLYYVFVPFGVALFKANIDVAVRVITGKIRPGIVKITPDLKSDLARMILADSITLTPRWRLQSTTGPTCNPTSRVAKASTGSTPAPLIEPRRTGR